MNLKPCPFCGSEAEIYQSNKREDDWRVYCMCEQDQDCILGALDWGIDEGNYKTKQACIEAWNRRVNDDSK